MKPEIATSLDEGKAVITTLPDSRNISPALIVECQEGGVLVKFTKDTEDVYFRTYSEVFPLLGYTWNFDQVFK